MQRKFLLGFLGLVTALALTLPGAGLAGKPAKNSVNSADDTYDITAQLNSSEPLPVVADEAPALKSFGGAAMRMGPSQAAGSRSILSHTPIVGETRNWVGLDSFFGFFYRKTYTLRAIGGNAEIWVASELNRRGASALQFLDGDCRNGARTVITDAQADYLLNEFNTNMYPKESAAFSVPPSRDGSQALLGAPFHPGGKGDNIVVLVDNVRDDNFYDLNNTQGFSYIAGFFSTQLNSLFDRNIMSIDGFDWLHRTGANPPHEPVPGNNCTSAPARPFLYEGVFAHEYQHLLESYEDPDEVNWVNEGLSDWAQTLTGYVDPSTPITEIGFDSHTQCFLGWLGTQTPANPNPRAGGPENSLTIWEDQGDGEILCDYGAAYTIMELLAGRYGTDFMSALHRGDANGLGGLQEALSALRGRKTFAQDVLHDWSLMVALDGLIDDGARIDGNIKERDVTAPTLDATINWDSPHAYDTPGAPPNGADYVRLRDASGTYLRGSQIESLGFQGASTLPTRPVMWTVDPNPPGHTGNPALYSGTGNNRDEAIVRQVTVPTGPGANVTFDARWNLEEDADGGWDFAFVQISTDGGASYQSVACTSTTTDHNPSAIASVVENLPGYTGDSGGWSAETCGLSAYAGQTVHLAFRVINDPSVEGTDPAIPAGFWVDNIAVGAFTSDGSSLAGWQSPTEVRPNTVAGFTVYLISQRGNRILVRQLKLDNAFAVQGFAHIQKYVDRRADFVAAIVFYDDPSERSTQYAPYQLTVNGVVQPGGS